MARTTISLSGFKELDAALGLLPKSVGRGVLRRAGLLALEPMARAARQKAPVDEGELVESIDVGARAVSGGADIGKAQFARVMAAGGSVEDATSALRDARRAAGGESGPPSVELYMGPVRAADKNEAIKALAQEFGTSFHPPHPYLRPAFEMEKQATIDRLKVSLWDEIAKAAARQAKKAARG